MSLSNSTVSTVVKPAHKTDHYYHYDAVSFFLFNALGEKNQSNTDVSQEVRFVLYKNLTVKFISPQNTILYNIV